MLKTFMNTVVFYLRREPEEWPLFLRSYQQHSSGCSHELRVIYKGPKEFGRSLFTFRKAIRKLPDGVVVVLLNSFSRIACDGWLARLVEVAQRPEVGAAGCTASLESFLGNKPALWRLLAYPPWPNPHLRTNAIAMRSEVAKRFWPWFAFNKPLEHIAESGWWGLTNRLRSANLKCVVVGAVSEHSIDADFDRLDAPCFKQDWTPMVTDNRRCSK